MNLFTRFLLLCMLTVLACTTPDSATTKTPVDTVTTPQEEPAKPRRAGKEGEVDAFWIAFIEWLDAANPRREDGDSTPYLVSRKYINDSKLLSQSLKDSIGRAFAARDSISDYTVSDVLLALIEDSAVGFTHDSHHGNASFDCENIEISKSTDAQTAEFVTYLTVPNYYAEGALYQPILFRLRKGESGWTLESLTLQDGMLDEAPCR